MKFLVTEIQKFENGTVSTLTNDYDDRNQAESKFYSILAAAAVSELPLHAATMYNEEGVPIMNNHYYHIPESSPEPEPNEE